MRRWERGLRVPGLVGLKVIEAARGLPAVTGTLAPGVWKVPTQFHSHALGDSGWL